MSATHCEICDRALASDGDEYDEWRTVADGFGGKIIECVTCQQKAWDAEPYAWRTPRPRAICRECENGGNTERFKAEGSCTFGCGSTIDTDMMMCGHCKDHSANEYECQTCGVTYGDWAHGTWEALPSAKPAA